MYLQKKSAYALTPHGEAECYRITSVSAVHGGLQVNKDSSSVKSLQSIRRLFEGLFVVMTVWSLIFSVMFMVSECTCLVFPHHHQVPPYY